MCRSAKLSMWFVLLLIVALAACAPAATTISPTATRARVYHGDMLPTALPMPRLAIEGMFDVSGYKMHLECYGEGNPTIVLEPDFGVSVSAGIWNKVISYLATKTRVCTYDRRNAGARDSIGADMFAQATNEWHALMQTAILKPPYIVAGHSFGGLFALTYAKYIHESPAACEPMIESTFAKC